MANVATHPPEALHASRTPPLATGDRMSRAEFERRFDAMPDLKKAELIEGVVYVAPPVSFIEHGSPHSDVITWTGVYRASTPGVRGGDNASVRMAQKSVPQPDVLLFIDEKSGGLARVDEDGYVAGAPDWVFEVSASTVSRDLHDKLDLYRRHGVREYLVWRVFDVAIDRFVLCPDGSYAAELAEADGLLRSRVMPGLWLDVAAMLRGDLAGVLRAQQSGNESPDRAAFVADLQRRAAASATAGGQS